MELEKREYICGFCNKKFIVEKNFNDTRKDKHKAIQIYCPYCTNGIKREW